MKKRLYDKLSMRERQIMDVIYRLGEASAAQVQQAIPDPPGYSAVRALLAVLQEKGLVKHEKRGRAYVYQPTVSQHKVRDTALKHVVQTFFDGSVASVVTSLVNSSDKSLSDEDFERLEKLVREKRKQRRQK